MLLAPFAVQAASAVETPQIQDQQVSTPSRVASSQRPTTKMQGYRIQIYSGVKGRESKQLAYKAGERCHDLFPELGVYCKYNQPRWNCRVGDFSTLEEARHYAGLLRETGAFSECNVVKSQIKVVTPSEPDDLDSIITQWVISQRGTVGSEK